MSKSMALWLYFDFKKWELGFILNMQKYCTKYKLNNTNCKKQNLYPQFLKMLNKI